MDGVMLRGALEIDPDEHGIACVSKALTYQGYLLVSMQHSQHHLL
jgi:hypothetical protein